MGVWVLATFWEMPFQLAISPFNLIYRVMEYIGKKVGCILYPEASCRRTMDWQNDQTKEEATIYRLAQKYP
jgi:hypothetical protein